MPKSTIWIFSPQGWVKYEEMEFTADSADDQSNCFFVSLGLIRIWNDKGRRIEASCFYIEREGA